MAGRISSLRTHRATVPLRRPFTTAVRSTEMLDVLLVAVADEDGRRGWGEVAMSWRVTGEGTTGAAAALEGPLREAVLGLPIDAPQVWARAIQGALARNSAARAALDAALWDLHAQRLGLPLREVLANDSATSVRTDMTIAIGPLEDALADAAAHVDRGFRTLKVKVGTHPAHDDRLVRALRSGPASESALRVDANQGWSADDAIRILRGWEDDGLGIELVEQPTRADDVDALVRVREAVTTPVLADESMWGQRDLRELIRRGAADLVNIKLAKCGGVTAARELAALAAEGGVGVIIGCMLESVVGVSAAAHVAATLPPAVHDLDAAQWLHRSPVEGGARSDADALLLSDDPGLGILGEAA